MSGGDDELTYEALSTVYRMENGSSSLTQIRKDFYPAAQELIAELSKQCDRLAEENPDSIMYDGLMLKRKNAIKNLKKIVELRMKKISGMATLGAMGSNNVIDDLTPEEKEYYNTILEASKSFWKLSERKKKTFISQDITRIDEPVKEEIPEPAPETKPPIDEMPLSEIPFDDSPMEETPAEPVIEEPPVEQTTVPEEVPEEPVPEKVPEAPADVIAAVPEMDDDALVVIRILEDLPPFSGPDVNYDLKKEDIVRMPAVMAKALINRGKARIVTTA